MIPPGDEQIHHVDDSPRDESVHDDGADAYLGVGGSKCFGAREEIWGGVTNILGVG